MFYSFMFDPKKEEKTKKEKQREREREKKEKERKREVFLPEPLSRIIAGPHSSQENVFGASIIYYYLLFIFYLFIKIN